MVMDITGASSSQAASTRGKVNDQPATENKQTNGQSTPEAAATISGISLSDAAQAIQKGVGDQLSDSSSVNEQRVAELKLAVENGTYKVDYESTARNLFQIESQLDNQ